MTTSENKPDILARKGATRPVDVPGDVPAQLNAGTLTTATLAEGLALDFAALMQNVAPEVSAEAVAQLCNAGGILKKMQTAGGLLLTTYGEVAVERFSAHPSDTVRGWTAYTLALVPALPLAERLTRIRPLAADPHFGVREWAWLAMRPHIAAQMEEAIPLLTEWHKEESAKLRRFSVEISRPRGVWCAHIPALKTEPQRGLPLLEPVRADPTKYVQDSVSNWLNDAAKSQPEWVKDVCERWRRESDTPATLRICKRALRSIRE